VKIAIAGPISVVSCLSRAGNTSSLFNQILVISLFAILLTGCFSSDYDVSQQLKIEFPVSAGRYVLTSSAGSDGFYYTVTRRDDHYEVVTHSPDNSSQRILLRFYRVPEFDGYVAQLWDGSDSGGRRNYMYAYARAEGERVTFLSLPPGHYDELPQDLKALLDGESDKIVVRDGARDALYVVREVARRGVKLSVVESYVRQ